MALFVVKKGFRFPYSEAGVTAGSTNANLKFLEAQLDRYLHSHDAVSTGCSAPSNSGDLDDSFETGFNWQQNPDNDNYSIDWASKSTGGAGSLAGSWERTSVGFYVEDGSWAVRAAGGSDTYSAGKSIFWPVVMDAGDLCDGVPASAPYPFTAFVGEGATISASCKAGINSDSASSEQEITLRIQEYDVDTGAFVQTLDTDNKAMTDPNTYTSFSFSVSTTMSNSAYIVVELEFNRITGGGTVPLQATDDWSISVTGGTFGSGTTLYIFDEGFRMPYGKTRKGLERNMMYVERQLEEYLHDHITDDTGKPYIVKSGFRFPYDWGRTGALERNVKFLERQLEEYLHAH